MKTPREIAEGIVGSSVRRCIHDWYPLPELGDSAVETLEAAIASAIQAERDVRPPKGHIVTDDGVVRKVLGTLPMTADGCVATINGTFYTPQDGDPDGICGMAAWAENNAPVGRRLGFCVSYVGSYRTWNSNECYSTREAAEAAKKETT